jgi:hypothetical protein
VKKGREPGSHKNHIKNKNTACPSQQAVEHQAVDPASPDRVEAEVQQSQKQKR